MQKPRYETIQIMPPAMPTWAVFREDDGSAHVVPVHAWGLDRLIRDEEGHEVRDAYSVARAYVNVEGQLECAFEMSAFVDVVVAERHAIAMSEAESLIESRRNGA